MKDLAYDYRIDLLTDRACGAMARMGRLCAHAECNENATHEAKYKILHWFGITHAIRNVFCEEHARAFAEIHRLSLPVKEELETA